MRLSSNRTRVGISGRSHDMRMGFRTMKPEAREGPANIYDCEHLYTSMSIALILRFYAHSFSFRHLFT